jgi:hypothetical protein
MTQVCDKKGDVQNMGCSKLVVILACKIPDIINMQNRNKMLEMAE